MLLESQYSQFKEDLHAPKPKGGAAFITDFERKELLAITHGKAHPEQVQANSSKPAIPAVSAIALAPPRQPEEENNDLPRFEDDWPYIHA